MAQAPPSSPPAETFATLSREADAARDSERLDEALALYRKALTLRPTWAEGWWSVGTISYDRSEYPEAAKAFQKLVVVAPRNGTAFVMLGLSEFELNRDDLALKHIERGATLGLDKNPELHHVALYHEGVLLQRQGKFESAKDVLQQLCREGVESEQASLALGMTLLRQRSRTFPEAGSGDAAIAARVGRAGCLSGQSKFDDARSELSDVLSKVPKYPGIHYAFGVLLADASDLDTAVAQFKEEIENNPKDLVSRLQIAAATYKINSRDGLPYAAEAVKLAPHLPFAHYLLGMLLLDTDDYQHAIPELEVARNSFPTDSRIYLALGTAYARAGRRQEAATARATAVRLSEKEKKRLTPTTPASGIRNSRSDQITVGDLPASLK